MNIFGDILESPYLPVRVSVCPSVYKMLVSIKGLAGVLSHILVTALVFSSAVFGKNLRCCYGLCCVIVVVMQKL